MLLRYLEGVCWIFYLTGQIGEIHSHTHRRHCISVSHDQRRKLSCVSDVHIIVKSDVIDGLRLEGGQKHSQCSAVAV